VQQHLFRKNLANFRPKIYRLSVCQWCQWTNFLTSVNVIQTKHSVVDKVIIFDSSLWRKKSVAAAAEQADGRASHPIGFGKQALQLRIPAGKLACG